MMVGNLGPSEGTSPDSVVLICVKLSSMTSSSIISSSMTSSVGTYFGSSKGSS